MRPRWVSASAREQRHCNRRRRYPPIQLATLAGIKALFVNLRDGRSLPFQVPEDFTLQDDENFDSFMTRGGGFLSFSDGTQLWVSPHEFVTAYLVPLVDGQRIALRA